MVGGKSFSGGGRPLRAVPSSTDHPSRSACADYTYTYTYTRTRSCTYTPAPLFTHSLFLFSSPFFFLSLQPSLSFSFFLSFSFSLPFSLQHFQATAAAVPRPRNRRIDETNLMNERDRYEITMWRLARVVFFFFIICKKKFT